VHEANQVGRTENDRGAKPSGDKSIGNRELPFSLGPHELTADETSTELQEFWGPLKIGGLVRSINPLNEADTFVRITFQCNNHIKILIFSGVLSFQTYLLG
jgi:hypothetical protein